ncbi:MAG: MerR family transcriptional regulator [Candidatus Nanopelagicales bacterium]
MTEEASLSAGEMARHLGVPITTLRTWDRRYGLGPEGHEPGRHRRYGTKDKAQVELMRQLVADGVAPSRAARRARGGSGAPEEVETTDRVTSGSRDQERSYASRSRALRRAALALDPGQLDRILVPTVDEGVVPAWTRVICPAMRHIGERNDATGHYVDTEHMLSAAVTAVLARVTRPSTRPNILLACVPEEQHALPLEALAAALAEVGQPCLTLGARVPMTALTDAISRTGPDAVVLWAHLPVGQGPLEAVLSARPRAAVVAACGPGWPTTDLLPGILRPSSLRQAVALLAPDR